MENTKIGRPDEFDFSVILPYFENFDKLDSLYNKEYKVFLNDLDFISLANEITTNSSPQTLLENFQTVLKKLWTLHMLDYIPEGWNLPEGNSHNGTYGFGIAGTYHIFRQSDGFVLDMI